jgi:4-carboxymuconolactone decarboxylase
VTRTANLVPEEMTDEQRRIYEEIVASRGTWLNGPYAPMLHQPRLAEPAQKLGEFLRYHTSLSAAVSELVILVIARHWDCQFEWYQHAAIAARSGVTAESIESIRTGQRPLRLSPGQEIAYAFARALLEQHSVPADLYATAQSALSVVGVVELTGLIGYYTLIAFTLNAHEVSLPSGVSPPLPPLAATRAV